MKYRDDKVPRSFFSPNNVWSRSFDAEHPVLKNHKVHGYDCLITALQANYSFCLRRLPWKSLEKGPCMNY